MTRERLSYTLDNFEGPIPLLLQLVQKCEIDISEISLHLLTSQFPEDSEEKIDEGAEFISVISMLLWLKSRALLPEDEVSPASSEEEEPSPLALIPHLIEYCRFKELSKELDEREQQQSAFYSRGNSLLSDWQGKKPLGIDHISLQDFGELFQEVLRKAQSRIGVIHEEVWRVSDMIAHLRAKLIQDARIRFEELFPSNRFREELIVIFLAILELMKQGELRIVKDPATQEIWAEAHGQ